MFTPRTPTEIALAQENDRLRNRIRELEGPGKNTPTLLQMPYDAVRHQGDKQVFHRIAIVRAGFTGPHGDLNIRSATTCWKDPYKSMSIEQLVAAPMLYDAYDCINVLEQVHQHTVRKLADLIQRDMAHPGGAQLP